MTERDRVKFVVDRDGPEAARKFAEQGLALYTEAAIRESKYREAVAYYKKYLTEST